MKMIHRIIQEATGAPAGECAILENIMREEIFHSTLDWQSWEQLKAGAQQAQQRLESDREWYVQTWQYRQKILQQMQAGTNLAAN